MQAKAMVDLAHTSWKAARRAKVASVNAAVSNRVSTNQASSSNMTSPKWAVRVKCVFSKNTGPWKPVRVNPA
ncbi:hypothetical protein GCM10027184_69860 [Saccharothrix stipae]